MYLYIEHTYCDINNKYIHLHLDEEGKTKFYEFQNEK